MRRLGGVWCLVSGGRFELWDAPPVEGIKDVFECPCVGAGRCKVATGKVVSQVVLVMFGWSPLGPER